MSQVSQYSGETMRKFLVLCTAVCLSSALLQAQDTRGRFVTFDAPGASSAPQGSPVPMHGTIVADINARGEIIGHLNDDANTVIQTFIRYPDGRIVVTNDPAAATGPTQLALQVGTTPYAINDAGVATGTGVDQNGHTFAFVRSSNGSFTNFNGPQSVPWFVPGTASFSINNKGQTTGGYTDYPIASHAFIRDADGTLISFDAPDASFAGFWNGTTATNINTFGDVCGYYHDANAVIHSFLRLHTGQVIEFEVPGAGTLPYQGAFASRITDQGVVIGFYEDENWQTTTYVRYPNGQIVNVVFPQIPDGNDFGIANVNHAGDIAGSYLDANSGEHAFLLKRNGQLFHIDAPNAGAGVFQGTIAVKLTDSGDVAGYFIDANNVSHGFLWTAH
jgi:hypothetical protein